MVWAQHCFTYKQVLIQVKEKKYIDRPLEKENTVHCMRVASAFTEHTEVIQIRSICAQSDYRCAGCFIAATNFCETTRDWYAPLLIISEAEGKCQKSARYSSLTLDILWPKMSYSVEALDAWLFTVRNVKPCSIFLEIRAKQFHEINSQVKTKTRAYTRKLTSCV